MTEDLRLNDRPPAPALPVTVSAWDALPPRYKAGLSWFAQKRANVEAPCCCFQMTDEVLSHLAEEDVDYVWRRHDVPASAYRRAV